MLSLNSVAIAVTTQSFPKTYKNAPLLNFISVAITTPLVPYDNFFSPVVKGISIAFDKAEDAIFWYEIH